MNKQTKNMIGIIAAVALAVAGLLAANSNDVILVPGAGYGNLTYNQNGTADDPVVVWGNGATAECVRIGGQYITLRDLNVDGCNDHGILVSGKHIIIENNDVTHAESDRFTSDGQYCKTSGGFGSAIKLMVGAEDVVVRGNNVHQNCGEGIAATRAINSVIENNTVVENHNVGIYVDNSYNIVVRDNYISCGSWNVSPGTNGNGISLGQENYGSEWGKQLHDVLIEGNTIEDCRIGVAGFGSIGKLIRVTINSNLIPSGTSSQSRAISLLMSQAEDVFVTNNGVWWTSFTLPSSGVVVSGNYLYTGGGITPTTVPVTVTASRTPTLVPPTASRTPTLLPPTVTRTPTAVVSPTNTPAVVPTVCEFSPSYMICTRP